MEAQTRINHKRRFRIPEKLEDLFYLLLGMFIAFLIYHLMAFALHTSDPIVSVVSCSMLPTLDRGDLLVVKGVTFEEIVAGRKNGTIIVYRHPVDGRLIVHRVYEKLPDGTLRTWGDNNPVPDPWVVPIENVVGKVMYRIPYLGYPKIILSELVGATPSISC